MKRLGLPSGPGGAGRAVRPVEVARAAWGASLLLAPRAVLRAAGSPSPDRRAVVITRVLGVRHLVQAGFSGLSPAPAVLACGAWVDTVHSGTAVALAVVDRPRARLALVDAAIALAWALASRRDIAGAPEPGPDPAWTTRVAQAVLPLLPWAPSAERR